MSRLDGLWIGLKLLGAYFLISGLAEAAWGLRQWAFGPDPSTADWHAVLRREVYRDLIRSGVHFVCGFALLATADYFAPLERRRPPSPPPATDQH